MFVEHALPLTKALCGFQFVLNHLDGRQLLIKSHPREVVKPTKLQWYYSCVHDMEILFSSLDMPSIQKCCFGCIFLRVFHFRGLLHCCLQYFKRIKIFSWNSSSWSLNLYFLGSYPCLWCNIDQFKAINNEGMFIY